MKKIVTYLLQITLFVAIMGAVNMWVSEQQTVAEIPATGFIYDTELDFAYSAPDEMLLPAPGQVASLFRLERVQQTLPQSGFTPRGSYLVHHSGRDYHNNYTLAGIRQDALPPCLDPSLEYVFLLRRILI